MKQWLKEEAVGVVGQAWSAWELSVAPEQIAPRQIAPDQEVADQAVT
jgi:hypothetical protein